MQTGSSETLIGWKSWKTTYILLWDRMEGGWLWTRRKLLTGTCHIFGLENRKKLAKFTCHSHSYLFSALDPLLHGRSDKENYTVPTL